MTRASRPDKRTAIIETALDLIAERGFHGTAMAMIAKASGASAGIIYHYFASKDDLINALYYQIKGDLGRAILENYAETLPLRERLNTIWRNTFHYYLHHQRETAFLEQYENSPYHQQAAQTTLPEEIETLVGIVQHGVREGVIKDLPIEVLYDLTLGVALALAKRQLSGAVAIDAATIAAVADACWDAIKR